MNPIILIGAGGHCKSIIEVIDSQTITSWKIAGLVGLPNQVGLQVLGYEVLGTDKDLQNLRRKYCHAFIAIGQIGISKIRKRISILLDELGFNLPSLISFSSIVSKYSKIGNGSFVGHGAILNSGASIGDHCIINTKALIEHDAVIESFCHISTGAIINGGSRIGYGSFIGSGCIIREGLVIPPNTIIGAGKCVMGWPQREKLIV